jgi:hypothetical protein
MEGQALCVDKMVSEQVVDFMISGWSLNGILSSCIPTLPCAYPVKYALTFASSASLCATGTLWVLPGVSKLFSNESDLGQDFCGWAAVKLTIMKALQTPNAQ